MEMNSIFEHGNEPLGSTKGRDPPTLPRGFQTPKKDPEPPLNLFIKSISFTLGFSVVLK